MAITIQPHNSQAGIQVASGGRAASYVGASAFVTPGQSAMPGTLQHLARGIDKVGHATNQLLLDRQRLQNATDLLADKTAEADAFRAFDSDYRQTHQGSDARTAAEDYAAFFSQRQAALEKKWQGNPFLLNSVKSMFARIRESGMNRAVSFRDQQEEAHKEAVAKADWQQTVSMLADPSLSLAERQAALQESESSLRMLAGQRWETDAEGHGRWVGGRNVDAELERRRQFFHSEQVETLIALGRANEAARYVKAHAGDFGERSNNLQGAMVAAMERASLAHGKAQENALKVRRASVEKDIYAKAYEKTLTRADVEEARDLLSPEDYFKALKLIEGKTSLPDKSDPEALIFLQRMAVDGDPAIQETADDFLRAGRLTNGDYSKMLNESQQWRKPVIRQADEVLKLKTGYSEMNPNPDAGSSYLMARDDFQTWLDSDEGKKAGDEEKLRMASRVGDNYRIAQAESILAVPVPLFLVGSRTMPDIKATIAATNKARAEGRLTETEYAEQARRIKRMADILERQTQETSSTKENRR